MNDTGPEPYETIATFYEAEHRSLEADAAYYARHGSQGPLLVLGCGTGRIGRLLGSTRDVTGLDRSAAMLALARQNAPHANYILGDMTDFSLGTFSEIVIPNGAFNFLATRAQQSRCLECCARTLPVGGELVIDMPMPIFSLLGTPHTPEKLAWEGVIDGANARRTREVRRYPSRQRLELTDRYYIDDQLVTTTMLPLRWVFPAEVEWMLESSSFAVESIHGNYAAAEINDGSPRILARAMRV